MSENRTIGVVVGVADMAIATPSDQRLITYALGSCIGLTAYDPEVRVGGMLHLMLPQPSGQTDPKQLKQFMYATTGIPLMIRKLVDQGAVQRRLVLCASGGAEILANASSMAIGKRNRTMMRRVLWKMNLPLASEDCGGSHARTMTLDLNSGVVDVRVQNKTTVLWQGRQAQPLKGQ